MASVKALRDQAKALEQDLKKLEQSYNAQVQDLKKSYDKQLKDVEDQFKQMRIRDQANLKKAYEDLKLDMQSIQQKELEAVKKQVDSMNKKREKLLKQMENLRAELQKELKNLIDQKEQEEQVQKKLYGELAMQANLSLKDLEKRPHEFFFPGELAIIKQRISKIQNALKHKMYQAASSMVLSAETEAELLKIKTERELLEWNEMFSEYKLLVRSLSLMLKIYSDYPLETPSGVHKLSEEELNFWSKGVYGQMAKSIKQMERSLEVMEQADMNEYLKTQAAPKGFAFRKLLRDLEEMEVSLQAVMEGIGAECYFSDERSEDAKHMREMMKENGYICTDLGYAVSEEKPDLMDSYEMVFCLNAHDKIFSRIIPVREHGIAVGNRCILWIEMNTIPEMALIRDLMQLNCERMKEVVKIPVVVADQVCEEPVSQEQQWKKQPNILQYEKYRKQNRKKGVAVV